MAQKSDDSQIEKLENLEREALLKGDITILQKLLSPQIVVQNPENKIVTYNEIIERIKSGKINYSSFERRIENISHSENIAIVMGEEIITPHGVTAHAGKTVTRRFTNIWMQNNEGWKLIGRQTTIISVT